MHRLLTSIAACAVLLHAVSAQAQPPLQTIYYDNGQKALEGHWSYTVEGNYSLQPPLQIIQEFTGRGGRRQHKAANSEMAFLDNLNLFIRPDGLIKGWYPSGKPMFEIPYVDGVAKGRFKSYYDAGGTPIAEGAFENGMPTGTWTTYDATGRLMMRGNYVPYTQAELAERWKDMYITVALSHDHSPESRKVRREKTTAKEALSPFEDSMRLLPYHVLDAFKDADLVTQTDGKREGDFMLIKSQPADTLYLHYTADVPTGIWHHTGGENAGLLYGIEYGKTGHPVAFWETAARRTSVAQILQTYRRQDSARMSAYQNNSGDPNGIDPGIAPAPPPPVKAYADSERPLMYVEQMPEFNGDLIGWLKGHMMYPAAAQKAGIEGRAVVRFIIRSDGSLIKPEIVRSSGNSELDAEALRVVRAMPKWKPGKQQGKAVNVQFTLPITFSLPE